jgi:EAL domain-containing protein (putative c-di-GMP-specific phosphodiesterase class I)
VDTLKIDRSFVVGINESSDAEALMHLLVHLGTALGLETVAEGIEVQEQYTQLQREECDSGQGFLIARHLDARDLEMFLIAAMPLTSTPAIRHPARPGAPHRSDTAFAALASPRTLYAVYVLPIRAGPGGSRGASG